MGKITQGRTEYLPVVILIRIIIHNFLFKDLKIIKYCKTLVVLSAIRGLGPTRNVTVKSKPASGNTAG